MDFSITVKGILSLPWQHFFSLISLTLPFAAAAQAQAPVFAVRTASGPVRNGVLLQLNADGSIQLSKEDAKSIPGAEVLSLRRVQTPLPPLPREDHLILANGDRIPFRGLRLVEETIRFRHAHLEQGKEASVPLAAVSLLWFIAPDKTVDAEKLRRRLRGGTRKRDTVCLRNGDVIAGVLTSLDTANAVVEVDKRRVTVKVPQVAYIAFNTELADSLRPKGTSARLILSNTRPGRGGRLTLTSATADATTLTGTTVFGARVQAPLRDIAALQMHRGNSVYLSDLKEREYSFQPFLDVTWPFTRDGNVAEHDLRLAGSTYDKGIGMHSRSRLSYRLAGAYRRFDALAGLDDKDGRGGEVRLRVGADGATLFDRIVASSDGAVPIRVNVAGVRELTLEVDFGRKGDVRGVVNWVNAQLVK